MGCRGWGWGSREGWGSRAGWSRTGRRPSRHDSTQRGMCEHHAACREPGRADLKGLGPGLSRVDSSMQAGSGDGRLGRSRRLFAYRSTLHSLPMMPRLPSIFAQSTTPLPHHPNTNLTVHLFARLPPYNCNRPV